MKIKYYGVRGSIPVSGKEYNKYGGNTTCILIEEANTKLVIDCGSGMRVLSNDLIAEKGFAGHKINVLFTHYHWDHLMGFPFFTPAYIKGNEINLYGETKYNMSVQDVLKRQQQFITFPVELSGMPAKLNFFEIIDGEEINIGPFKIKPVKLNHPAGVMGFRIETSSGVYVVATDYEHFSVPDNKLMALAKDADMLLFDTHFTPEDYPKFVGWGHSTYEEGIKMAQLAGVKELHMCHHAPQYDDTKLDEIQAIAQAKFENAFLIQEGWEVEIK